MLKSRMGMQSHVGSKMQNQESSARQRQDVDIDFCACAVDRFKRKRG